MSPTMPFGSSRSARKAARTTKVAPCNCCAGPKTAPRRECAIMMWSDTSTANTGLSMLSAGRRIADQRAARIAGGREQVRQSAGKVLEIDRRRQQCIERRVVEQRKRGVEPAPVRPAGAVRGRNLADLACRQPQPPAVKRLAERCRDVARSIPAQFDNGRLLPGEPQRRGQAGAAAARMKDEIALAQRIIGVREAGAE